MEYLEKSVMPALVVVPAAMVTGTMTMLRAAFRTPCRFRQRRIGEQKRHARAVPLMTSAQMNWL